jgi:uncharacterized damage-inducible protein DinB
MRPRGADPIFSKDAIRDLFHHMQWADEEVWRAVLTCEGACADVTIQGLLLHLHVVQRAFLAVWTGRRLTYPDPAEFGLIADLHAWTATYYAEARAFIAAVDHDALSRLVVMPWANELAKELGRQPESPTLAETMFQVTSHSTYHRGQVNSRLRAVGGQPPLVDYIAWIWYGRPSPAPRY